MNYYKITYVGRNLMGANMREEHTRILHSPTESSAIGELAKSEWGLSLEWPHAIQSVQLIEASNPEEYAEQGFRDAASLKLSEDRETWNKTLALAQS